MAEVPAKRHHKEEPSTSPALEAKKLKMDLLAAEAQTKKEIKETNEKWEMEKSELRKQIAEMKDKLLEDNDEDSSGDCVEVNKIVDAMLQCVDTTMSEIKILKAELAKQTNRAEECQCLSAQIDVLNRELDQAQQKSEELQRANEALKNRQKPGKSKKSHKEYRAKWEAEKSGILKQISHLKAKLLQVNASKQEAIADSKRKMDALSQILEAAQAEVEMLNTELAKQTTVADEATSLKTQLEARTLELQQANDKIKELEKEKAPVTDGQQQAIEN